MTEVARWKLTAKHYLNATKYGQETEWEQTETDRDTGRQIRKRYKVPLFLDPENPADCNYPGEIIVSHGAHGRDIVFEGLPTMDMEPLNEAAEVLSADVRKRGNHPIESLPGQGMAYGEQVMQEFIKQIGALMSSNGGVPNLSAGNVSKAEFETMQAQLVQLIEQNQKLMDVIYGRTQPEAGEPLPEVSQPVGRRA